MCSMRPLKILLFGVIYLVIIHEDFLPKEQCNAQYEPVSFLKRAVLFYNICRKEIKVVFIFPGEDFNWTLKRTRWCLTGIYSSYIVNKCYCFTWEQLCHLVCNQLSGHRYCMCLQWEH